MATINGYTAEAMKEIADAAIDSVAVVDEDLIITHKDGSTTNAGHVRGFPGISDMSLYDPVGVPKPYMGAAAPTGYGLCDAATEYDATTYPELAAMFDTGAACVNGPSAAGMFRLPNLKGRVLVGLDPAVAAFDTLHETGGSKDAVNVTHNHGADQPPHSHTADQPAHNHGMDGNGTHSHSVDGDFGDRIVISFSGAATQWLASDNGFSVAYTELDSNGLHTHTIHNADPGITVSTEDPGITIGDAGVAGTDKNLQPYRVVNYIMRLA